MMDQCAVVEELLLLHVSIVTHTYSKIMDQPGKISKPARGQPNREN